MIRPRIWIVVRYTGPYHIVLSPVHKGFRYRDIPYRKGWRKEIPDDWAVVGWKMTWDKD